MRKVIYGCDNEGNHQAPISECINTEDKTFSTLQEAESFIVECTVVHNLDEVLDPVPLELMPDINLDLIEL
jgi:hypothetical protein